ncbi:uncharacterized protein [Petaurus breviceps papuanus]|uniref:uncharacterized protein n=1 Tax=Petaurus breviceps papuanus TaxID=3040969 RepID=UPI0036DA64FA
MLRHRHPTHHPGSKPEWHLQLVACIWPAYPICCQGCQVDLRNISPICLLSSDTATTLVWGLITSCPNHCHSLLLDSLFKSLSSPVHVTHQSDLPKAPRSVTPVVPCYLQGQIQNPVWLLKPLITWHPPTIPACLLCDPATLAFSLKLQQSSPLLAPPFHCLSSIPRMLPLLDSLDPSESQLIFCLWSPSVVVPSLHDHLKYIPHRPCLYIVVCMSSPLSVVISRRARTVFAFVSTPYPSARLIMNAYCLDPVSTHLPLPPPLDSSQFIAFSHQCNDNSPPPEHRKKMALSATTLTFLLCETQLYQRVKFIRMCGVEEKERKGNRTVSP